MGIAFTRPPYWSITEPRAPPRPLPRIQLMREPKTFSRLVTATRDQGGLFLAALAVTGRAQEI